MAQTSATDRLRRFWTKHPILSNIILIFLALIVLGWLSLEFLDLWTHHGQTTRVPDVIGMNYNTAVSTLDEADLKVVIADSVYSKDHRPGSVVDIVPQPNAVVKAGREVYLTIVAFSPEPIVLDMLLTDISWKQAEAYLKSKGLRVQKRYVPSMYPDVVVAVKCNGKNLTLGSKVTVDDLIVIEVGQMPEPLLEDVDPLDSAINSALAGDEPDSTTESDDEL